MARKVPHLYLMAMKAELAAAFSETFDNVGETEIIRDESAHCGPFETDAGGGGSRGRLPGYLRAHRP